MLRGKARRCEARRNLSLTREENWKDASAAGRSLGEAW